MRNARVKSFALTDMMTEPNFIKGYNQVWAGKRFDVADIEPPAKSQCKWGYERGRQFAVLQQAHGLDRQFSLVQPHAPGGCSEEAAKLCLKFANEGWLR